MPSVADQLVGFDPAQIEALAARQDRDRNLADLGGGEDELGVRRRLFQGFQQRVEGRAGEHVHLVENVGLVACRCRRIADCVVDLAYVVDAVVGRGIHFQHVHMPAFHDRLAVNAERRHADGGRGNAAVGELVIERARQDARGRGLADTAHAGQDPGLRDAPGLERIRERAHHRVLSDQVFKVGRTVFACKHAIGAGSNRGRRKRGVVHRVRRAGSPANGVNGCLVGG